GLASAHHRFRGVAGGGVHRGEMAAALRAVAPLHGLRLVPHCTRIDPAGAGDAGSPALTGASQASLRRARAVLNRADGGEAAPAHLLADRSTAEPAALLLR